MVRGINKGQPSRSFPSRALRLALASCAVLASGLVLSVTQALAAGGQPVIGSVSATNITEHDATLEAQIDPDGLETKYEFWIAYAVCQPTSGNASCGAVTVESVGAGYIAAGDGYIRVSAGLTSLQPNYSYTGWALASNSASWTKASSKTFEAIGAGGTPPGGSPVPPPENEATPYVIELSPWVVEGTAKVAAELTAKEQAERKAKEVHEQEELQAREAPLRLVLAREKREAAEIEAATSTPSVVECVVPALKGDSLSKAQRALRKAHCRLGKVSKPTGRDYVRLVVTQQRAAVGGKLANGTRVGVTLGRAPVQEKVHGKAKK